MVLQVSRTRVARTRLTDDEYVEHVERPASEAGVKPAEFLRRLIVGDRDLEERLSSIERRQEHQESEMAKMWLWLKEREAYGD